MKRKVMILGGGYYQYPLIETANRIGYESIVCGYQGNYPGYKIASKYYDVDNFDKEACLEIAQKEKIDGICLCGSDAVIPTLGYIVDNMHLLGPSYKSTILASDKAKMKEAFLKNNVRTAAFQVVSSMDECLKFVEGHSFPVVLKVVDSSGSKGVGIIHSKQELENSFHEFCRLSQAGYFVIEEFIKGIEFGAQAFVKNKQLVYIMPHGDLTFTNEHMTAPVGHYVPYFDERKDVLEDIHQQLSNSIKALEIDNTAINADFILSNNKVYVLEIGARAGATCLPEIVSNCYHLDYYEYLLRSCVGEDVDFPNERIDASLAETLSSEKEGILQEIVMPDLKTFSDKIVSFQLYPKVGDYVPRFKSAYDRLGTIILKGPDLQELQDTLKEFHKRFKLKLKK